MTAHANSGLPHRSDLIAGIVAAEGFNWGNPMSRMNGLMIVGVILLIAGLLGFAIPVFTTQKTEDVARIGPMNIETTQNVSHSIPPILSGGVLVLGLVFIGMGMYKKP